MRLIDSAQPDLFGAPAGLPQGLVFEPEFITCAEEAALLALVGTLPLQPARYHQYTARRRVFAFGSRAGRHPGPPPQIAGESLPGSLMSLRQRLAAWAGVEAADFVQVMVTSYALGTPLGWHRDAPDYELIAGVSLGGPARLHFRPWPHELRRQPPAEVISLALAPRSAYLIHGEARWAWQHGVPPVPALRHSITMRTARV